MLLAGCVMRVFVWYCIISIASDFVSHAEKVIFFFFFVVQVLVCQVIFLCHLH